jgi:acetyltransferase-like isoleucine patch superfamily enzyme
MTVRRSSFSKMILNFYKVPYIRKFALLAAKRLEGGIFYSSTLREILNIFHGVKVGAYSYGDCLIPGAFPAGVTVGRYVSIASGIRIFLRNHPIDRLSLHPFFYNSRLGLVQTDTITSSTLEIGDDAWIGDRAIITPGCSRIGIGAIVGAGAVVTKNVPNFAIVAGNPAKLIRYRFDDRTMAIILESRWWEKEIQDLSACLGDMIRPLGDVPGAHPLLAEAAMKVERQFPDTDNR